MASGAGTNSGGERPAAEGADASGPRGVPRKIDQLGRVVIPSEYRKIFGIAEGDLLDLTIEGDAVVIRRVERRCVLCGDISGLFAFKDRFVCASCAAELARHRGELPPRNPA